MLNTRLAAVAAAVFIAFGAAGTADAAASLPSTNTAHKCVHHTTGVCGWNVGKKPVDKYETAKCKDGKPSYSRHSSGTCSGHKGVHYWFK
ncbi:Protein of unknown function DUF3761 [Actinobacteria bacterium OK074]|nr:Protein of unknown function DUF3761 [Actinobacteria bacterium OK074]